MFWGFDLVAIHFRYNKGYHYAQLIDDILQGGNKDNFSTFNWIYPATIETSGAEEGGVLILGRFKKGLLVGEGGEI